MRQQLIEYYFSSLEEIIVSRKENKWHGGDLQVLYHSSLRVEPQRIGTVNSNTGIVNTGIIDTRSSVSEKRKFPEINKLDPTEIEESNATSEDNEDVNGDNIINDEQVLDKKGLKKVAKPVIHHSICDAINKI
ncbi:hypothetical protein RhiirA5_373058 [Rhizophagus irregularis]|uniref:Uncharacterized protein n=1 Tax=Rhizophagus irregularis TaxID=588596 RepID=A0A2N0Q0A4_9GLOM|nr:hypothetical protein RhiirA5_373058 [Rhizophagus irregularis]